MSDVDLLEELSRLTARAEAAEAQRDAAEQALSDARAEVDQLRATQPPSFEEVVLADGFLSVQERKAFIAAYGHLTDARREVALRWNKRSPLKAAGLALPFSVPLPSVLLWIVMVGAASLMFVLVALFGKAGVEWTGDNDVIPRCRRLWVAAKAKAVRHRRPTEVVPDDGS